VERAVQEVLVAQQLVQLVVLAPIGRRWELVVREEIKVLAD
jgi:hypothetical protein